MRDQINWVSTPPFATRAQAKLGDENDVAKSDPWTAAEGSEAYADTRRIRAQVMTKMKAPNPLEHSVMSHGDAIDVMMRDDAPFAVDGSVDIESAYHRRNLKPIWANNPNAYNDAYKSTQALKKSAMLSRASGKTSVFGPLSKESGNSWTGALPPLRGPLRGRIGQAGMRTIDQQIIGGSMADKYDSYVDAQASIMKKKGKRISHLTNP